jgi:hypothetical protein
MSTRATFDSSWPLGVKDMTEDGFRVGQRVQEKGSSGDKTHTMKKTNFVRIFLQGTGGRGGSYNARPIWTKMSGDEFKGEYLRLGTADSPRHWHLNDVTNNTSFPKKTIAEYKSWTTQRATYLSAGQKPVAEQVINLTTSVGPDGATAAEQAYYSSFGAGLGVLNFGTTGTKPGGGGGGGGGGPRGSNSTQTSTAYELDSVVKLVVRMPIGYAGVAKSPSRSPGFIQTWREEDGKTYTEEFLFRYIPQNVKYDGLSSEWIEIPRAENIPFVDWSRWPLMKVSMSFLIALDRVEPGGQTVPDGMSTAVEPQIQKLRQMAQRKVPITFINMDELLTVQLRRGKELGRGLEFVINDMSVSATRRVTDFTNGSASVPSGISVAQVEMTFTEIPVERTSLVYLQPILTPDIPPPGKDIPNNGIPLEVLPFVPLVPIPNRVDTVYTDDAAVS